MKKILSILLILSAQEVMAQKEMFDIASFVPPRDWKKEEKPGAVAYSVANDSTGQFCAIVIFASTKGSGNVASDFKTQWSELAVKKHKADPNPKTEPATTEDGWKTLTGASLIKIEGIDAYILLTVFSGFGKRVSVISTLNDQRYIDSLETFLSTVRLDRTGKGIKPITENKMPSPSKPDLKTNTALVNTNNVESRFGHVILPGMDGWKQTRYSNGVSYVPLDMSVGYNLELRLMESKAFDGNLQDAFDISWKDATAQLQLMAAEKKDYSILYQNTSFHGWDYIRGEGYLKNASDDDYYLNLFVIKLNGRIERAFVVSQRIHERYGDRPSAWNESPRYHNDVANFLYELKFDDWKEPPAPPAKGMSGLYAGFKFNSMAIPTNEIAGLQGTYIYFLPDGRVYYPTTHISQEGLDGINFHADADEHARFWGTYSVKGNKGEINLTYGKVIFTIKAEGLELTTQNTPHKYIPVPSVDGVLFNGTYYFDGDWGKKPNPEITFLPNGKFIDRGAINILNHLTTSYYDVTREPGEGNYHVKNFTIIFDYTDGRKVRIVFTGLNYDRNNPSPKTLVLTFNDDILLRR